MYSNEEVSEFHYPYSVWDRMGLESWWLGENFESEMYKQTRIVFYRIDHVQLDLLWSIDRSQDDVVSTP